MKVVSETRTPGNKLDLSQEGHDDFIDSVSMSDISGMKKYLDNGGNINNRIFTSKWSSGTDALTVACICDNAESVRWLLKNGANPNRVKLNGEPILFLLVSNSQVNILADMVKYWDVDNKK